MLYEEYVVLGLSLPARLERRSMPPVMEGPPLGRLPVGDLGGGKLLPNGKFEGGTAGCAETRLLSGTLLFTGSLDLRNGDTLASMVAGIGLVTRVGG